MKLSIIIPVLNSHEIVRRQLLHYQKLNLPEDVEIILVDDGSVPALWCNNGEGMHPSLADNRLNEAFDGFQFLETGDFRPWTQPAARNFGAKRASGECFIFTDIDHVLTREAIDFGRNFKYDYGRFRRELAVLDENGCLTQDRSVLGKYGISENRNLKIGCHTLSMYIRANVFNKTGGFRERTGKHPTHDDADMRLKLKRLEKTDLITKCSDNDPDERPTIYMIPNGKYCGDKDANPFGLFHGLSRKQ